MKLSEINYLKSNIVSLFDLTGNMVRPLAERGCTTYCFDINTTEERIEEFDSGGSITFMQADLRDSEWHKLIIGLQPRIIFSFPPCTDLAVSGASRFKSKLAANPLYREQAMQLVYVAADIAKVLDCEYMIENPVSVISTEWRKPDYIFQPYEYGGYLSEDDVHPIWPEYIVPRDAYNKRTCLWTSKDFTMPPKLPVEPLVKDSAQYMKLGGKSQRTKDIRSATPRGVCKSNGTTFAGGQI